MKKLLVLLFLSQTYLGLSQTTDKTVIVKYIDAPIVLDAQLNEASWSTAKPATSFWQYFPSDTTQAKQQASIKFLFDDKNLYIGAKVNRSRESIYNPFSQARF